MGEDRVAIVVDSAASLPADIGQMQGAPLLVVPMQLTIGDETYLDGRDITPNEFYRMQRETKEVPTTSAPSPSGFLDTFRSAAKNAPSILCLTVSPNFSASYDSAKTAAKQAEEEINDARIAVVDTESAAGGEGLIAMAAWRAAQRGVGLEKVAAATRAVASKVSLLAFLDTLYYVWKSGRVPRVAYAGTSLLRIKPMFELSHGQVRNLARPRMTARAIDKMFDHMQQRLRPGPIHVAVMHSDAMETAEELSKRIESEFPCEELYVSESSPVMGAHTGPGLLGIAFWSEEPEE